MTLGDIDMAMHEIPPPDIARPVPGSWEWRRGFHFGASEMAALLVALGWRDPDEYGSTVRSQSKRLLHRKAGLARPLKRTPLMARGSEREAELWREWRTALERGTAGPEAGLIDPASLVYVEGLPEAARVLSPIVDHECPEMAASLDVVGRDLLGRLLVVDIKASFKPYEATRPRHVVQLHAQMACTHAEVGHIVEGVRWSNNYFDERPGSQPIRTHEAVERNDALIAELRAAAREGMERVRALRAAREEAA